MSDKIQQISKQLEFYFGDSNYPLDKFLQKTAKKNDGWVPIKVISTFKKIKQLTEDVDDLIKAVELNEKKLIELSEDKLSIKRVLPLEGDAMENLRKRQIFFRGFPTDYTIDDISKFFKDYGNVLSIRLQRGKDKEFIGKAFVEFETEELKDSVMAMKGEIKCNDTVLSMEAATDRHIRKQKQYQKRKNKMKEERKNGNNEQGKKKKQKLEQDNDVKEEKKAEVEEDIEYEKGLIVDMTGIPEGTKFQQIQKVFEDEGFNVAHIHLPKDSTVATLRFPEGSQVATIIEQLKKNEIKIGEEAADYVVVTGEREEQFWRDFYKRKKENKEHKKNNRKYGRGGGYRGRKGRKRKR